MANLLEALIDAHDPEEIVLWAKLFGVTEAELRGTILKIGAKIGDVAPSLKIVPAEPQVSPYLFLPPFFCRCCISSRSGLRGL